MRHKKPLPLRAGKPRAPLPAGARPVRRARRERARASLDGHDVLGSLAELLARATEATEDYTLEEVTVQLGVSAEGRLVFARATVDSSVSLTFKRQRK